MYIKVTKSSRFKAEVECVDCEGFNISETNEGLENEN